MKTLCNLRYKPVARFNRLRWFRITLAVKSPKIFGWSNFNFGGHMWFTFVSHLLFYTVFHTQSHFFCLLIGMKFMNEILHLRSCRWFGVVCGFSKLYLLYIKQCSLFIEIIEIFRRNILYVKKLKEISVKRAYLIFSVSGLFIRFSKDFPHLDWY